MQSKYTMRLELIVSTAAERRLVLAARRAYSERGAARLGSSQSAREISAEEFIDGIQNALIELVEGNMRLQDAGLEVRAVSCSAGEPIEAA